MKSFAAICVLAAISACAERPGQLNHEEPASFFVGVKISELPEPARTAVTSADKDISLVLRGLPPSCKAEADSVASDGGTAVYNCEHYDLVVMQSIYEVGNVTGVLYGPIVTFPGDYPISFVRFYSNEKIRALLYGR